MNLSEERRGLDSEVEECVNPVVTPLSTNPYNSDTFSDRNSILSKFPRHISYLRTMTFPDVNLWGYRYWDISPLVVLRLGHKVIENNTLNGLRNTFIIWQQATKNQTDLAEMNQLQCHEWFHDSDTTTDTVCFVLLASCLWHMSVATTDLRLIRPSCAGQKYGQPIYWNVGTTSKYINTIVCL